MINIEKRNRTDIITFSVDRINALIIDEISEGINKVFENSNSKVIINLSGVEYIDSSGFGLFLSLKRSARHSYSVLKFSNLEPAVTRLFEMLHLHSVFEIYNDLDSCIASFK